MVALLSNGPDDARVAPEHLYLGPYYEREVMNVIDRFVRPGDVAIDAGAGIGFFAVMLGHIVGEKGLVLAFEPDADSFKYLVENVHVEAKLNNVACIKQALWKVDGDLKLWSVGLLGYSSIHELYENGVNTEIVEGRKLDTLLGDRYHPRFIKIDCEGAELEVLQGAEQILKRGVDGVVLELNYSIIRATKRDLLLRRYMADLGYQMYLINIADGLGGFKAPIKVDPTTPIVVQGRDGGKQINVLFSTDDKVNERWPTMKGDHDG